MLAAALTSDRAKPLEREVQRMRLVKSRRELGLMKDAADLSADAHAKVSHCIYGGAEKS
jgi:intermediate cleaving peptidase 55